VIWDFGLARELGSATTFCAETFIVGALPKSLFSPSFGTRVI